MNRIYKVAIGAAVIGPALLASSVFAAGISDARFSNNDVTIDAQGNATVSGTYTLTVNPGEAIEYQRATVNGITTDVSVGGSLGFQEGVYHNLPFTAKVPPNTGTWNVDLSGDGIYGANRAISAVDAAANSWMGATTVGTVRVTASGSTSSTGGVYIDPAVQAQLDTFSAKIDALIAAIAKGNVGSSNSSNCPVMIYTGDNASGVQAWLMAHGEAGPFNAVGVFAPTGFWGNASKAAYQNAVYACK